MSRNQDLPEGISAYDRAAWRHLEDHWQRKSRRREVLPPKARGVLDTTGRWSREVISQTGEKLGEYTPAGVKRAGEFVLDEALVPTIKAAGHLLEVAEEWAAELMDPATVLHYHRSYGHAVDKLTDLHHIDLEELDRFSRRMSLRWRSSGALEGAAMGALAFIPVVGTGVSVTVDVVVMQLLGVAIASRAMYSYGYDAKHPDERQMVERIVRRAYRAHAPKARAVHDASRAYKASKHRIHWSQKLRDDHRLMAAVERLMKQVSDGRVSVQDVSKKMPAIGVITSAGFNAYLLGDIAKQGVRYGQTRHLSEKYGLPLPPNLLPNSDDDEGQSAQ